MESFYQDPREAARVLYEYLIENPDEIEEYPRRRMLDLLGPGRSIAQAISDSAEIFFAYKSKFPKAAAKVGAMLATTATYHNINGFATDGGKRGNAISAALRRHAGEKAPVGASWPAKEDDPVPLDVYLPPVEGIGPVPAPEPMKKKGD